MVWTHLQFRQLWGQKTNKQTNKSLFRPLVSYFEDGWKREILGLHLRMQSVCKRGMLIIGDAEITSESLQLQTLPQACSKHWLEAYPFRPLPWWVMLQPFKRDESMYCWCRKGKGPGTAYDVTNCAGDARDMCTYYFDSPESFHTVFACAAVLIYFDSPESFHTVFACAAVLISKLGPVHCSCVWVVSHIAVFGSLCLLVRDRWGRANMIHGRCTEISGTWDYCNGLVARGGWGGGMWRDKHDSVHGRCT